MDHLNEQEKKAIEALIDAAELARAALAGLGGSSRRVVEYLDASVDNARRVFKKE